MAHTLWSWRGAVSFMPVGLMTRASWGLGSLGILARFHTKFQGLRLFRSSNYLVQRSHQDCSPLMETCTCGGGIQRECSTAMRGFSRKINLYQNQLWLMGLKYKMCLWGLNPCSFKNSKMDSYICKEAFCKQILIFSKPWKLQISFVAEVWSRW